ncbi:MAG: shikimate kinase AroK [Actinomycetota bacterium]|nr:shikimate kinase AroK [Actinomycetota bacterium]
MSRPGGGAPPTWSGNRLFLVGMMGSGKTTVGRLVATALGWQHCDSDAMVEARTGHTVVELARDVGEAAMHAEEAAALREAAVLDGVVVSVAGGAVLDPASRSLLGAAGPVVWLRARPDTLATRVAGGGERPLVGSDAVGRLRALDAERRPFYVAVSQAAVDVDGQEPEAVAHDVLLAFERLRAAGPGS